MLTYGCVYLRLRTPCRWSLYWWSDEDAQIFSCSLYMAGNAVFAAGSICFFPKITFLGGVVIEDERLSEYAAAVLFIVGSVLFSIGAVADFLALVRDHDDTHTEASALVQPRFDKPSTRFMEGAV